VPAFRSQIAVSVRFEALAYEMPSGLMSRTGILWHDGRSYVLSQGTRDLPQSESNALGFSDDFCGGIVRGAGNRRQRIVFASVAVCQDGLLRIFRSSQQQRGAGGAQAAFDESGAREEFVTDTDSVLEMTGDDRP
jgi:hypothetical protein